MSVDSISFRAASARNAYQRYTQRLTSHVRDRVWVDDPSFALARDEEIYAKIRRDPVFAHAIDYRRRLAAGREWNVEPASDDPLDRKLAIVLEALLRQLPGFTGARYTLAEAIFRGSAWAYVEGERRAVPLGKGFPELHWWVPTRMVDVDRRRFRLYREGDAPPVWQLWSLERRDWQTLTPDQASWFVRVSYESTEDTLGYGRGLLDTLYYYAMAKTQLMDLALRAGDRFGHGTVVAQVARLAEAGPVGANESAWKRAEAFREQFRKHREDGLFVIDAEDKLAALSGLGEGWQFLQSLIEYIDARVTTCVLGSNLPTSATAGGSYALADVQASATEAMVEFDREILAEHLTAGLLNLIVRLNRAPLAILGLSTARVGKLAIVHERTADDPEKVARAAQALMSIGLDLRKGDLYRRAGFTPPEPGDDMLAASSAPPLPGSAPAPVPTSGAAPAPAAAPPPSPAARPPAAPALG